MLFRDSTFPLTNVRSSFLVEHFESLIRDIVESSVSAALQLRLQVRPQGFPVSLGVTVLGQLQWFLFGFGVKHSVRLRCFLVLG